MTHFEWIVVLNLILITALLAAILDKLSKLLNQFILKDFMEIPHLLESIGDGLYTSGKITPPRDPNFILDEEATKKVVDWPFRGTI